MKIGIVGLGFVGLSLTSVLSSKDYDVIGIDVDKEKREKIINGYLIDQNMRDKIMIQVDGGIKLENYKDVISAGGDILVAGSQVFQSQNPIETIIGITSPR